METFVQCNILENILLKLIYSWKTSPHREISWELRNSFATSDWNNFNKKSPHCWRKVDESYCKPRSQSRKHFQALATRALNQKMLLWRFCPVFFFWHLQRQKIIINACSFHLAQLSRVFFSIFLPFLMRLKLSHNVALLVLLNLIISIPFISFLLWSIKRVG